MEGREVPWLPECCRHRAWGRRPGSFVATNPTTPPRSERSERGWEGTCCGVQFHGLTFLSFSNSTSRSSLAFFLNSSSSLACLFRSSSMISLRSRWRKKTGQHNVHTFAFSLLVILPSWQDLSSCFLFPVFLLLDVWLVLLLLSNEDKMERKNEKGK